MQTKHGAEHRTGSARTIACAAGSLFAFANPAGRYPAVSARTITTRAWARTGNAIRLATTQFDAGSRKAS